MNDQVPPISTRLSFGTDALPSMGRMLVEMGKLTPEDARRVRQLQSESDLRFGEAARRLGLVTEDEIQEVLARQFSYPCLPPGTTDYPAELVAAHQPFSDQVEGLRAVRSQLLRWFRGDRKGLVVAGVYPGDGASFFAANLAVLFAQMGERTLLIDANLRHPRQHKIFNLRHRRGLSDVLAGRGGLHEIAAVEKLINLSVLPAGTVPPNPQELVSRNAFPDLVENLAPLFQPILVDVSAFSTSSDAIAVAAHVGGVLLVTRKNVARIAHVNAISNQLASARVTVVGSVLLDF